MTDTRTALTLPLLIGGRRIGKGERLVLSPRGLTDVSLPVLTPEIAAAVEQAPRDLLVDVPTGEIVAFLNRAGKNWRNEEYARRRIYIRQLQAVLGFSEAAAQREADWIGAILTSHARMLDMLEVELGSRFLMDEWVRSEEAHIRAFPAGLVAHVLPGNVPSSTLMSALRALLTKNVSVLKPASGDPLTAVFLAMSLIEVDPAHPVARAVNVAYWPEGDPLGESLVRGADAVCAWGSAPAIEAARRLTGPEASFLAFGPKRSMALVRADADLAAAALGIAHDVSTYDQAACFSCQRVFVESAVAEPLVAHLRTAFERYETLLGPRSMSVDEQAGLSGARLEYLFAGGAERFTAGRSCVIELAPAAGEPPAPLERTLIVHPVDDLREACAFVDAGVQTVSAAPWEALADLRDELARRGVSRLVEVGLANFFRIGGTHDGLRPLQRLVRYAGQEAPAAEFAKGMVLPMDQTKILENRNYQDVVF